MPIDADGWIEFFTSGFDSQEDFGVYILQIIIVVAFIWVVRWLILRLVLRSTRDASAIYWTTKVSSYIATALSLFVIGQAILGDFGSLLTFVGLIAAGLAIALKDPVTNMFAWFFIVWRRPFELGHRIQIGGTMGDVVDIRLFQTSLLELGEWVDADLPTGRIVHVPNSRVFTHLQYNYSVGVPFIWDEIPVLITFESDWQKAKELLVAIVQQSIPATNRVSQEDLRRVSQEYRLSAIDTEPVVITSVLDSGVLLTLRYTVKPIERRLYSERIWEAVLRDFAEHPEIDFAYPTTRFYNNRTEGPMAGPE